MSRASVTPAKSAAKAANRTARNTPWTKARKLAFEKYVCRVQNRLGLSNWEIDVDWSRHPRGSCAEISRWSNQQRATFYVGHGFMELSDQDRRNTVVHELTHCLLFDLHDVAEAVADQLGGKAATLSATLIDAQVEQATDRLAGLLERGLPYMDLT